MNATTTGRPLAAFALLLAATFASGTAQAGDVWRDPYPGVRWLHRTSSTQNINAVVVDLCAAGVSARTTASSERRRTPSSFGAAVGAQIAVNGDFFSYTDYSTNGVAAHDGAAWGGADHGYVGPVAFGDRRADIVHHSVVDGTEPWMREIVSGHPTILRGGTVEDHSGDPLCANRHPRTVVGMSADRRTLYIAVIDGRATGRIGMTCVEEANLLRELGASIAVNMDGGGSSAMWLAGHGVVSRPSDGSQRVVANHLAIHARGSGPAAHCPNAPPRGHLDAASCDGIRGWTEDTDTPGTPIDAHIYIDGPAGADGARGFPTTADVHRDDLCTAIGSCSHGYVLRPPRSFMDGLEHEVFAYGIDSEGGANTMLAGSPQVLRCDPPEPPLTTAEGVLRHVTSPEVMTAWGFTFVDVATLDETVLSGFAHGEDWPAAPELVSVEGEPAVYVADGEWRRHVTSPAVMEAWGFPWDGVAAVSSADLALLEEGATWMDEPFLVSGDGPAVYVVDRAPPGDEPVGTPDGGGAGSPDGGVSAGDGGAGAGDSGAGSGGGAGRPVADDRTMTGGCAAGGSSPSLPAAMPLLLCAGLLLSARRPRSRCAPARSDRR